MKKQVNNKQATKRVKSIEQGIKWYIKKTMKEQGVSGGELSKRCGVSRSAIYLFLNQNNGGNLATYISVLSKLGIYDKIFNVDTLQYEQQSKQDILKQKKDELKHKRAEIKKLQEQLKAIEEDDDFDFDEFGCSLDDIEFED